MSEMNRGWVEPSRREIRKAQRLAARRAAALDRVERRIEQKEARTELAESYKRLKEEQRRLREARALAKTEEKLIRKQMKEERENAAMLGAALARALAERQAIDDILAGKVSSSEVYTEYETVLSEVNAAKAKLQTAKSETKEVKRRTKLARKRDRLARKAVDIFAVAELDKAILAAGTEESALSNEETSEPANTKVNQAAKSLSFTNISFDTKEDNAKESENESTDSTERNFTNKNDYPNTIKTYTEPDKDSLNSSNIDNSLDSLPAESATDVERDQAQKIASKDAKVKISDVSADTDSATVDESSSFIEKVMRVAPEDTIQINAVRGEQSNISNSDPIEENSSETEESLLSGNSKRSWGWSGDVKVSYTETEFVEPELDDVIFLLPPTHNDTQDKIKKIKIKGENKKSLVSNEDQSQITSEMNQFADEDESVGVKDAHTVYDTTTTVLNLSKREKRKLARAEKQAARAVARSERLEAKKFSQNVTHEAREKIKYEKIEARKNSRAESAEKRENNRANRAIVRASALLAKKQIKEAASIENERMRSERAEQKETLRREKQILKEKAKNNEIPPTDEIPNDNIVATPANESERKNIKNVRAAERAAKHAARVEAKSLARRHHDENKLSKQTLIAEEKAAKRAEREEENRLKRDETSATRSAKDAKRNAIKKAKTDKRNKMKLEKMAERALKKNRVNPDQLSTNPASENENAKHLRKAERAAGRAAVQAAKREAKVARNVAKREEKKSRKEARLQRVLLKKANREKRRFEVESSREYRRIEKIAAREAAKESKNANRFKHASRGNIKNKNQKKTEEVLLPFPEESIIEPTDHRIGSVGTKEVSDRDYPSESQSGFDLDTESNEGDIDDIVFPAGEITNKIDTTEWSVKNSQIKKQSDSSDLDETKNKEDKSNELHLDVTAKTEFDLDHTSSITHADSELLDSATDFSGVDTMRDGIAAKTKGRGLRRWVSWIVKKEGAEETQKLSKESRTEARRAAKEEAKARKEAEKRAIALQKEERLDVTFEEKQQKKLERVRKKAEQNRKNDEEKRADREERDASKARAEEIRRNSKARQDIQEKEHRDELRHQKGEKNFDRVQNPLTQDASNSSDVVDFEELSLGQDIYEIGSEVFEAKKSFFGSIKDRSESRRRIHRQFLEARNDNSAREGDDNAELNKEERRILRQQLKEERKRIADTRKSRVNAEKAERRDRRETEKSDRRAVEYSNRAAEAEKDRLVRSFRNTRSEEKARKKAATENAKNEQRRIKELRKAEVAQKRSDEKAAKNSIAQDKKYRKEVRRQQTKKVNQQRSLLREETKIARRARRIELPDIAITRDEPALGPAYNWDAESGMYNAVGAGNDIDPVAYDLPESLPRR